MADLDLQPVLDLQPLEEEKPTDLSKLETDPYYKFKKQEMDAGKVGLPLEIPTSYNLSSASRVPPIGLEEATREKNLSGPDVSHPRSDEGLITSFPKAIVADASAGMSGLLRKMGAKYYPDPNGGGYEFPSGSEMTGNVPAAFMGEPLLIEKTIKDIASDRGNRIESVLAKTSLGVAETAPFLALGGLPGGVQKLVAAGFVADMARKVPGTFRQLGEEMGKPEGERDQDKISSLISQGAMEMGFTALGAKGGAKELDNFSRELTDRYAPRGQGLGSDITKSLKSDPYKIQGPPAMGSMLKMPEGAEAPLNVERFEPLDVQSGSPLSPQELIARQSRVATLPETPQPEIKTYNLDEPTGGQNAPQERQQPEGNQPEHTGDAGQRPPAQPGSGGSVAPGAPTPTTIEPVAPVGDARGTPDKEVPQVTLDSVAKQSPEEFFRSSDGWAKAAMEDATKQTPGPQRLAETAATQNPDLPAWESALKQAQSKAKRINADVMLKPDSMLERQKEISGAAQKVQFFSEGIKAIKKLQSENPALVGMGAAKYGEVNGPKTPLAELEQQIHILSEQSPGPAKQRAAFDLGKRVAGIKDGITENLQGLKSAGSYLFQKLTGPPKFNDLKKAIGNRHLALTDSAINAREFVKNALKKIPDKLSQEAISNYVDAGGDAAVLQKALSETKPQYRAGYERALNLNQDEKTVAANIKQYFDSRLDDAQKNGILEDGIEDYIHRYYQSDTPWKQGVLAELRSGIFTGKPTLAKQRVFDYDFEAEKAGLKPVKSFVSRVAAYDLSLNKAIADRNIVKEMSQIKMPDGRPMVDVAGAGIPTGQPVEGQGATLIKPSAKPNSDKPLDNRSDYRPFDYPALRKWKWAGIDENGNPIMLQGDVLVHPDAVKDIKVLFERGKIGQNPIGRAALGVSSTVKQTMFDLSGFHPAQITVHGWEHRSSVPFNQFTAKFLGREFKPLTDYINDPDVRGMVRGGMVMGETTGRELFHEGLSGSSLTKYIPILGPKLAQYTDWLFNDYIPRLKAETGLHALERNQKRFPQLSKDELYHLTANQMNAAFGEQNYKMIGRSETMQEALRLGFVAPDFLESRAKFVGQAGTKFGREQFQALFLGAATMYLTARLLNKSIDGEYHFEPKNAFSVIYNGKAYSLRTVQGDVLQAGTDFEKFLRHRLNPVFGRTAMEMVTQRDEFGRTRDAKQQLKDFASTIVPISFRGLLNPREQNLMESLLNAFGITEHRASPTTLVYDLANKYKSSTFFPSATVLLISSATVWGDENVAACRIERYGSLSGS
jgi:hypothetical protein